MIFGRKKPPEGNYPPVDSTGQIKEFEATNAQLREEILKLTRALEAQAKQNQQLTTIVDKTNSEKEESAKQNAELTETILSLTKRLERLQKMVDELTNPPTDVDPKHAKEKIREGLESDLRREKITRMLDGAQKIADAVQEAVEADPLWGSGRIYEKYRFEYYIAQMKYLNSLIDSSKKELDASDFVTDEMEAKAKQMILEHIISLKGTAITVDENKLRDLADTIRDCINKEIMGLDFTRSLTHEPDQIAFDVKVHEVIPDSGGRQGQFIPIFLESYTFVGNRNKSLTSSLEIICKSNDPLLSKLKQRLDEKLSHKEIFVN